MAVVWPSKNNFANGDVLTATNMNNIGDTLNVFNPTSATNGQVWTANGSGSGAYASPAVGLPIMTPTSTANTGGTVTTGSNGVVSVTGACTSVSLNGVFTSAYKNYLAVWYSLEASAQTAPRVRLRAAGSDNTTASSYERIHCTYNGSPASVNAYSSITDHWELPDIYATYNSAYNFYFYEPQVAVRTTVNGQAATRDGTTARGSVSSMNHTQAVSYDGFTFYTVAGPTFAGFFVVYGLAS